MGKISIVIVDLDEHFLMPLERKFLEELKDNMDLIVISSKEYLHEYFMKPQTLDILVIHEDLILTDIHKHNIKATFALVEDNEKQGMKDENITYLYKYSSVNQIYTDVIYHSSESVSGFSQIVDTKSITVYAPMGGVGKTSVALSLCEQLASYGKKVIYIGMDYLQTHGIYTNMTYAENGLSKLLTEKSHFLYEGFKAQLYHGTYDIMLPFFSSLPSYNIKLKDYMYLLGLIYEAKEYDYVVLDPPADFTEDISSLMSYTDYSLILTGQDEFSSYKLQCLLRNIDCSNDKKFNIICNKFREDRKNYLTNLCTETGVTIKGYIEYIPDNLLFDLEYLVNSKSFKEITLLFM